MPNSMIVSPLSGISPNLVLAFIGLILAYRRIPSSRGCQPPDSLLLFETALTRHRYYVTAIPEPHRAPMFVLFQAFTTTILDVFRYQRTSLVRLSERDRPPNRVMMAVELFERHAIVAASALRRRQHPDACSSRASRKSYKSTISSRSRRATAAAHPGSSSSSPSVINWRSAFRAGALWSWRPSSQCCFHHNA
jgi:hypothetical protein